jgi:hypothetical protein
MTMPSPAEPQDELGRLIASMQAWGKRAAQCQRQIDGYISERNKALTSQREAVDKIVSLRKRANDA